MNSPETRDLAPTVAQLREEADGIRRRISSLQAEIDREETGVRTSAAGADVARASALIIDYEHKLLQIEDQIRAIEEGEA